jgi:hypothetical protein
MEALAGLLGILGGLAGLGGLICAIIVLIKLFTAEGALKGIFGFFCGIYTFIWGWQNVDRYNLKTVMMIWSVCFVVSIVVQVATLATVKS